MTVWSYVAFAVAGGLVLVGWLFRPTRLAIGIILVVLGLVLTITAAMALAGVPILVLGGLVLLLHNAGRRRVEE